MDDTGLTLQFSIGLILIPSASMCKRALDKSAWTEQHISLSEKWLKCAPLLAHSLVPATGKQGAVKYKSPIIHTVKQLSA